MCTYFQMSERGNRTALNCGLALWVCGSCGSVWAEELPAATPYRPTISNPAELSAPGWLEVEAGGARTKGGGLEWRNNFPVLLKLAFSEDMGVMLGGDVHVRQTDTAGASLNGRGDTLLMLKNHWSINPETALGLEWGAKFATAAEGLGSGKRDYAVNGIYSRDIAEWRVDANLGATRLGLEESGLGRMQYPWAAAVSRPAGEDWTLALEASGAYRQGANGTTQLLGAASYNVTKQFVVDFGAVKGIAAGTPNWSAFAGLTYLMARLW